MSVASTYFNKWKRAESEKLLSEVFTLVSQYIPDRVVRTSLRWSFANGTLDEWPSWHQSLYNRLGLQGYQAYRQLLALRQKSDDWDKSGTSRSDAAWEKYCRSEVWCGLQNRRMRSESQFLRSLAEDERKVLFLLPELIADVLGPCPGYGDLPLHFGPGANVSCRGGKTSARYKLSAPLGVSLEGLKEIDNLRPHLGRFLDREIFVESAQMAEVPKNAKTNRTIEFQPLLNTFVQLGIGTVMKKRLRESGINLYTQDLNKEDARSASLRDHRSTIDFESASDSLSVRVVQYALSNSHGWFDLLASWRCGHTQARTFSFNSEKFSAMGNGYTFELESLIFWALARSVVRVLGCRDQKISIYGDDLICTTEALDLLTRCCESLGFRINSSKSFSSGPFRESCGKDYVLGIDTRPYYVRGRLTTASVVSFANFLYATWRFEDVREHLLTYIPKDVPLGPQGLGDGHIATDDTSLHSRVRVRGRGFSGWKQATIVQSPRRDKLPFGALENDSLLPLYPLFIRDGELDRDRHWLSNIVRTPFSYFSLRGGERSKKRWIYLLG